MAASNSTATVEWAPHRTLYARTLAEHVECTRPCDTDLWRYRILRRSFWLRWSDTPPEERFGLVEEEPASLDEHWDAFVAGYAQELCCRYQMNPPEWVFKPAKYLGYFWFPVDEIHSDYRRLRTIITPAPWLQEHGVLLWDRELVTAQELIEGKGSVTTWKDNSMEPFTKQSLHDAFTDIGNRLRIKFVKGGIYLVGGAAVAMAYDDSRTTMDVDARIEAGYGEVEKAVHAIARERGWPTSWLNEQPVYFIPKGEDLSMKTVFSHPNLVVRAASPKRLIAMKMLAGRRQDIEDIAVLLSYTKDIRTVDDLVELMHNLMPDVDISDETARDTAEQSLQMAGLL